MAVRALTVTGISAKDLKDVRRFHEMEPSVTVSLSGEGKDTSFIKRGGTCPRWDERLNFTVNVAEASAGLLKLTFVIKTKRKISRKTEVGRVEVAVKDLLKQWDDDGNPKVTTYELRAPSGQTEGSLEFSYEFDKPVPVAEVYCQTANVHPPNAAPVPVVSGASQPVYQQAPQNNAAGRIKRFVAGVFRELVIQEVASGAAGLNDG